MSPAHGASYQVGLMSGLKLRRLGTVMESEPGNQLAVQGALNPGAARGLQFTSHHRLAAPVSPWDRFKIGAPLLRNRAVLTPDPVDFTLHRVGRRQV